MWWNRSPEPRSRIQTVIVILGIWAGDYWFMHVERGQIHIFYVLLFASMYFIYTSKWNYAEFISGFIGGLFIFFRPFTSMIALGFLQQGKIKWLKGWITGIGTGLLIFVAPHPAVWNDYFKAMKEYGYECMKQGHFIPDPSSAPYPSVIEGASNLTNIEKFNITSMPALHGVFRKLGINYTPLLSYLTCGLIFIVLSVLFFKQRGSSDAIRLFLFAFLTYMVEELFLLNWRTPYCVIEWIFPLFLIIQQIKQRTVWLILLFTSLLFLHSFPFYFRYQVFIGELVLLLMVFYFSISEPGTNNPEIELQKTGK